MRRYHSKFPSSIGTVRFASIAVSRKYVTPEQVQNAIVEQDEDCFMGRPPRFLGEILLENNLITEEQMESILEEMNTI